MNHIFDFLLNRITMYRLALYILITIVGIAIVLGSFGIIPYSPITIVASMSILIAMCLATNKIFATIYNISTNVESVYITALILTLIVSPVNSAKNIPFLLWVAFLAMASKYMISIKSKHIFNPAAVAVALTSITTIGSANWWVGTLWMSPFVVIGGYFIIHKLQVAHMIWWYLVTAVATCCIYILLQGGNISITMQQIFFGSPLFFLGGIMVTEPSTLPPTKRLRMIYGAIIGFLFVPFVHIGSLVLSPELALLTGNLFSYFVSSKQKLAIALQEKIRTSAHSIDFIFMPYDKFVYLPGQYMEWTLPHVHPDSRGNRRFFSLASSPTEATIRLGIRFYKNGSSFKKALEQLDTHTSLIGRQLAGDFTLPKDNDKRLVFMAGGVGITPFRSMIKYLIDTNQKRDIKLFYSVTNPDEFVYRDIFQQASIQLGIETIYIVTGTKYASIGDGFYIGRITPEFIQLKVPDYGDRLFYLSGPHAMVVSYGEILRALRVKRYAIKKDFFPGYI